ncbi:MAG TPA: NAD(P)-dependent oxidoreductase, partial [Longimicrobiales bacterium]
CETMASTGPQSWTGHTLVHVGSALEYGTSPGNLSEDTVEQPTTLYGRTKLSGTQVVANFSRQRGLHGITARLFTVYGPGERAERLLPTLLRAAREAAPIPLTAGLQRRDFTYVEEVADGLLRLGVVRSRDHAVVNLASGRLNTVREFVETAADIIGLERERLRFGALPTRQEEMSHAPVTNERLRSLTGWTPQIDIMTGLRRTAAHRALAADR